MECPPLACCVPAVAANVVELDAPHLSCAHAVPACAQRRSSSDGRSAASSALHTRPCTLPITHAPVLLARRWSRSRSTAALWRARPATRARAPRPASRCGCPRHRRATPRSAAWPHQGQTRRPWPPARACTWPRWWPRRWATSCCSSRRGAGHARPAGRHLRKRRSRSAVCLIDLSAWHGRQAWLCCRPQ